MFLNLFILMRRYPGYLSLNGVSSLSLILCFTRDILPSLRSSRAKTSWYSVSRCPDFPDQSMPVLQTNLIFQEACPMFPEEDKCALMACPGLKILFQFQPSHLGTYLGAHLQRMLLQLFWVLAWKELCLQLKCTL